MSHMQRFTAARSAVALLFVAVLAVSALAETPSQSAITHRQIADQLTDFRSTASALRREADTLDSPGSRRVSWQTQSYYLQNIADHVNDLGRALSELEAMKPHASEGQQVAIEHARIHLVSVAQNTTRAFELMKDSRNSVKLPAFVDVVSEIQMHAEALHTKLDTILDFEGARVRREALDLSRSTEGS